jgi:hypothetical protein
LDCNSRRPNAYAHATNIDDGCTCQTIYGTTQRYSQQDAAGAKKFLKICHPQSSMGRVTLRRAQIVHLGLSTCQMSKDHVPRHWLRRPNHCKSQVSSSSDDVLASTLLLSARLLGPGPFILLIDGLGSLSPGGAFATFVYSSLLRLPV